VIYSVRHTTTFRYDPAVRESVMEVRLQPRSDGDQRCLSFSLQVDPFATAMQYRDFAGNTVHHFDIAGSHKQVKVTAHSTVDVQSVSAPRTAEGGDWNDLDAIVASGDYWEMLLPSQFACASEPLSQLATELNVVRRGSPLSLITELNEAIYKIFAYVPHSTRVDSPIEDALRTRQGVCQDFAHIMIAGLRGLGLPAAYVSGYIRSVPAAGKPLLEGADASHAWVSLWCGSHHGWIGLDPTNGMKVADEHVVLAVGRDYDDISPIHGILLGPGEQEIDVAVHVIPWNGDRADDLPAAASA